MSQIVMIYNLNLGVEGFEPPLAVIKKRCLTPWLHSMVSIKTVPFRFSQCSLLMSPAGIEPALNRHERPVLTVELWALSLGNFKRDST